MDPSLERHRGKYYGKYSGFVTDNADDQKMGRVKVQVPSVFGTTMEVLAWPCFPAMHFYVPPVGAKVWVEFEAGDISHPLWVGQWYPQGTAPAPAQIDPPDNRVLQTPSGHTIEILDKDGEEKILIKHKGNAFFSIDKDGSVTISNQNGSFLFLNSKDGEVSLIEEHQNVVTMTQNGILIVNQEGAFVELKGGTARIVAADGIQITGQKIVLDGSSIALGGTATDSPILLNMFTPMYNAHVHASAIGPTGPPVPPLTPAAGSMAVKSS